MAWRREVSKSRSMLATTGIWDSLPGGYNVATMSRYEVFDRRPIELMALRERGHDMLAANFTERDGISRHASILYPSRSHTCPGLFETVPLHLP